MFEIIKVIKENKIDGSSNDNDHGKNNVNDTYNINKDGNSNNDKRNNRADLIIIFVLIIKVTIMMKTPQG